VQEAGAVGSFVGNGTNSDRRPGVKVSRAGTSTGPTPRPDGASGAGTRPLRRPRRAGYEAAVLGTVAPWFPAGISLSFIHDISRSARVRSARFRPTCVPAPADARATSTSRRLGLAKFGLRRLRRQDPPQNAGGPCANSKPFLERDRPPRKQLWSLTTRWESRGPASIGSAACTATRPALLLLLHRKTRSRCDRATSGIPRRQQIGRLVPIMDSTIPDHGMPGRKDIAGVGRKGVLRFETHDHHETDAASPERARRPGSSNERAIQATAD